jgi:hypothetical protein
MTQSVIIDELKPFIGKLPDEFISRLENFLINKTDLSPTERCEFFQILDLLVK